MEKSLIEFAKLNTEFEMCGLILCDDTFILCENVAIDKVNNFEIDSDVLIKYDGQIKAIVHSHNNSFPHLSACDIKMLENSGLDWVLVCDDKVKHYRHIPNLIGREFIFNRQDCYNLFRDVYMLAGIDFPQFKYVENWYEIGQNLYVDNLIKYGFEQVETPEIGDVVLFAMRSEIPNHCGVYIGNNYILHHALNQLSKRDLLNGYWLNNLHSFWRYKWKSQLNFTETLKSLDLNLS